MRVTRSPSSAIYELGHSQRYLLILQPVQFLLKKGYLFQLGLMVGIHCLLGIADESLHVVGVLEELIAMVHLEQRRESIDLFN
jgi:hypothetical protein